MVGPFTNSHNFTLKPSFTLKFLCSYGGKILPRYPDGKLRYQGGETRVLAVERSISFAELMVKLAEMCGTSVSLRCQLPNEDLDALVSITSDEDLSNLIEEYDRAATIKIRAFLSAPKSAKKVSSPTPSTNSSPKSFYSFTTVASNMCPGPKPRCGIVDRDQILVTTRPTRGVLVRPRAGFPIMCYEKAVGKPPQHVPYQGHGHTTSHACLPHPQWQPLAIIACKSNFPSKRT